MWVTNNMIASLLGVALLQPLELALNAVLARDPHIMKTLASKALGRSIRLSCTSTPGWQITLQIHADRLMLLSASEDTADAHLSGSQRALLRLLFSDDPASALHDPDIQLSGDVQLTQSVHRALAELDTDWQDLLAPILGDLPTRMAGSVWQHGRDGSVRAAQTIKDNLGDFLQEETALLPTRAECDGFTDELDAMRLRLDRLQARIQQLEQLVTN